MSALAAIAGATALYSGIAANQASQKQKGLLGKQQTLQEQNYAALSPFRNQAAQSLNNANIPQDYTNQFTNRANPYAAGGSGTFAPITSGQGAYAPQLGAALSKLTTAPTPTQLAQSQFQQLLDQAGPQLALADQKVGQDAAKFGTLGAGRTTSQLGDVQTVNQRNLTNAAQSLANTAGQQTLQDYMNELAQIQGMNQNDLSLRTQQQGVGINLGQQAVQNNAAQLAAQQGAQAQQFGEGISAANVGFNPAQQPNYTPMANYYGNEAQQYGQSMQGALAGLGNYLGNKPAASESASNFGGWTPIYQNTPKLTAGANAFQL